MSPRPAPPPAPPRISPLPFAGMIGLACVLFLDLGSLAFLPWWGVALLVAVWLVLMLRAVTWWTPYPSRVPWVAAVGVGVWVVAFVVRLATA